MMRRPGRDETLIAAAVCADRGYTRARTPIDTNDIVNDADDEGQPGG
jgi:hypothetical protein